MDKRKWLWKKRSFEKSPGETESSESVSSHSERYSDDQEAVKVSSPNGSTQSPEVTSKAAGNGEGDNDFVKSLTEKLSAALVNVSAKEDLVKQHAKVAEEAVAGWEKAENELAVVKQQLDATVQKKVALEDRVSHLDGALKECVRQLRQSREEQEQRILEAVEEKTREWESTKLVLDTQLLELQTVAESAKADSPASADPELILKLESLGKENSLLKLELHSQYEELELRTIERDLSTQAAETASKQHLESIKKAAKLEAECRRLQAMARKSTMVNDQKSVTTSSLYADSLTDGHSDSGDQLNALDIDSHKASRLRLNEGIESNCSDWALALISELDQFKNDKGLNKSSSPFPVKIDIMDDFLEMERIAALPEIESKKPNVDSQQTNGENELKTELDTMSLRMADLEEKLKKIEAEKNELENALNASQDSLKESKVQLMEAEMRLEELQRELSSLNESKELLEFQLVGMEVETRSMSANIALLKAEVEKEQSLSAEMAAKCRELEDELTRKTHDLNLQQTANSNRESKVKQEDIAAAAGKLAECQKTMASLGRQLKSLATLEDFLTDTTCVPRISNGGSPILGAGEEGWKLHSNDTFKPNGVSVVQKKSSDPSAVSIKEDSPGSSSSSASSSASSNLVNSTKSRSGFGKLFSRSRSGIQLENQEG